MRYSLAELEVTSAAASFAAGLVFIGFIASLVGAIDLRPVLLGVMFFGFPLLCARRDLATGRRRWRSLLVVMAVLETLAGVYMLAATLLVLVPSLLTTMAAVCAFRRARQREVAAP